ncbi:MAG: hypothetical protein HLX51_11330 [Micrococcaceae bacterium]|nr:hypothetical protein [Micrococcaceae bacterium]
MTNYVYESSEVEESVLSRAVELTLIVLNDPDTPNKLAKYYDPAGDYVGASFVTLEPHNADRLTSSDLMATSMLNVGFPASAIRRLLQDTQNQADISEKLRALPSCSLEDTTTDDLDLMGELYCMVKPLLADGYSKTSNRWVTTSKLLARKRPSLFPVRDRVVCGYLDIMPLKDYRKDWQVFRHLMQNEHVRQRLAELPLETVHAALESDPILDTEPLRILDAALWMYAR